MKRRLGQVCELLQEYDAIAATTLRRLGDECLPWILSQMMLEVSDFVRKEEAVRHELIVNWEEPLEAANDDAENVLLGEMVHQRIPVEDAFTHLYDVKVMVSERHAIPENGAVARLGRFSISIFANDILHGVKLTTAMIRVHDYLRSAELRLLASVHQMVLMDAVFVPLTRVLMASRAP